MKLHFDHALVTQLLAHAEAAKEHTPTFDQLYEPTFLKMGKRHSRRLMMTSISPKFRPG